MSLRRTVEIEFEYEDRQVWCRLTELTGGLIKSVKAGEYQADNWALLGLMDARVKVDGLKTAVDELGLSWTQAIFDEYYSFLGSRVNRLG